MQTKEHTSSLPQTFEERVTVGDRDMVFETGRIAGLADGSVTVSYGDTVVLSTAVASKSPREGIDFFPLTVDYEERMSAAGKIPGGFLKREGRPSEYAILSARLTDRPIRPLFPKGFRNDVHIVSTVLSADQQNQPDVLSINGASTALTLSSIPFEGPVGAVRVGYVEDRLIANPTADELEKSDIDIVVAGTRDAIMMVEGQAQQVSEDVLVDAIEFAHRIIGVIVEAQLRLREAAGKPKADVQVDKRDPAVDERVREFLGDRLSEALYLEEKSARNDAVDALKDETVEFFAKQAEESGVDDIGAVKKSVAGAYDDLVKERVREAILKDGYRPDGRGPEEIRPIWGEVSYLPRTHGSAIFTRGQTQAVSMVTLGSTREDQLIDNLTLETSKRYMHHYNFPPYSVNEARFMRGPSRRDIGHGMLAERALLPVLPPKEDFPYVVRVISEIVSSNGSTSMASVCGSTMSLMDAGVPITSPVAGIAMGLVTDGQGGYRVLSDIQGMEDFLGDMDFKVAGTRKGVTAIQMDIKVAGITTQIMREALAQAREGRYHILDCMAEVISEPRTERSKFAPSIATVKIAPEKIGAVIGPGGKTIRSIQEDTETEIDVQEDGSIFVAGNNADGVAEAIDRIKQVTWEPNVGDIVVGPVKTIIPVGAFVAVTPDRDGFVHISELGSQRYNRVEDAVSIGDVVEARVTEIRPDGKINLSMRGLGDDTEPELPKPGDVIEGTVRNIIPAGAFVQVVPGRDGFVHISNLGERRYERVEDAVSIGDTVKVRVTEIRPDGKIDLTMKGVDQD
ncbi:MAG: polyribonucleotide nucleotidyltransferase [Chloroflexota bacterium]